VSTGGNDFSKDWALCYSEKLAYTFSTAIAIAWAQTDCVSAEASVVIIAEAGAYLEDYFKCS
jgi:hypothetical protein